MASVICDKCKKDFNIQLKERKRGNGIEVTYFECNYCSEKYTAVVTDSKARTLQRKIKRLMDSLSIITNIDKFVSVQDEIQDLQDKLGPILEELKVKHGV